jgi:hypothetical protein
MPQFNNREEYEQWKEQKIKENEGRAQKRQIAQEIESRMDPSQSLDSHEEKLPSNPFFDQLPGVFVYPFQGHGKYILIAGVIFFLILKMLSFMPFIGFFIAIFAGGYLGAYMMKIIISSSDGKVEAPDWPDFSDFWDDILKPFFLLLSTVVFSFSPVLIYVLLFRPGFSLSAVPVLLFLLMVGLFYMPMSLIAVSLSQTVRSLNPFLVIPSIRKVLLDYVIAMAVLVLIAIVQKYLVLPVPVIGFVVGHFVSFYFLMVEMRILGLIYYTNQERFNWFGEAEEIAVS